MLIYVFQKLRSILAYRYGVHKGLVPVATEHVAINDGISIPVLNGWFAEHAKLSSAFVVSTDNGPAIHRTVFYIICAQPHLSKPVQDHLTSELLVFRKGVYTDYLVNIRSTDLKHMKDIIKWYAFL